PTASRSITCCLSSIAWITAASSRKATKFLPTTTAESCRCPKRGCAWSASKESNMKAHLLSYEDVIGEIEEIVGAVAEVYGNEHAKELTIVFSAEALGLAYGVEAGNARSTREDMIREFVGDAYTLTFDQE